MATHPLTGEHVLRETYDPTTGSLKTIPSSATSFSIELDAADGDNVTAKPDNMLIEDTQTYVAVGMKSAQLYTSPGAAATAKIQVSPIDSAGDVWIDVPSGSIATDLVNVTATAVLPVCARRVRVVIVAGTPVFHLVLQSV